MRILNIYTHTLTSYERPRFQHKPSLQQTPMLCCCRGQKEIDDIQEEEQPLLWAEPETKKDMEECEYRDARGFAFIWHVKHGMLLLRAFKKRKGMHYQIPGGNVDRADWGGSGTSKTFVQALLTGVTREIFEETGMDFRGDNPRVCVVRARGQGLLAMKDRYYVIINITDDDSVQPFSGLLAKPIMGEGESFRLKLSKEHLGFYFEPDLQKAEAQIKMHSGGKNATALRTLADAGLFQFDKQIHTSPTTTN
eukprot:CFRG3263T1